MPYMAFVIIWTLRILIQKKKEDHPENMYFTRFASRYDLHRYFTEKIYEDERYLVYKIQIPSRLLLEQTSW